MLPFALFALLFLILPTIQIVFGAFQTPDGAITLKLEHVLWVRVERDEQRLGFGA